MSKGLRFDTKRPVMGDDAVKTLQKILALRTGEESTNVEVTSDGTALAANPGRVECILTNTGTSTAYIRRGAGATTTNWDYALLGGNADVNGVSVSNTYDGLLTVAFAGGTGNLRVSELT